jgi:hypothetical protein
MAEGLLPRIPGYDDSGRSVLGQDLDDHQTEAIESVGREATRGGNVRGEREERSIGDVVAVKKKERALVAAAFGAAVSRANGFHILFDLPPD